MRKGHDWRPAGPNGSRCKRCDAERRILDDGEVQFFTADGTQRDEAPVCIPKSGDRATRGAEACV